MSNTINKIEIEESFEIDNFDFIQSIYYNLKEKSNINSLGILENTDSSSLFEFVELIKNNVDMTKIYKKKYNL